MYKDYREEEKIEYSINTIDVEISHQSLRLLGSRKINPKDVMRIACVSGGDHGNITFQFGVTIIFETTTEKLDSELYVYEVLCRTDSPSSWRRQCWKDSPEE